LYFQSISGYELLPIFGSHFVGVSEGKKKNGRDGGKRIRRTTPSEGASILHVSFRDDFL